MILTIIYRLPEKCLDLSGKTFLIGTYIHNRLVQFESFFHFMIVSSRMIEVGAKVGKANGLRVLLDAETFDYTFHLSASEGFKMAVQHHLGKYFNMKKNVIQNCIFFCEMQLAFLPLFFAKKQKQPYFAEQNNFSFSLMIKRTESTLTDSH